MQLLPNRILLFFVMMLVLIPLAIGQRTSVVSREKLVSLPISVWSKDKGFVKTLNAEDFEIYEGKRRLDVLSLTQNDEPLSIGILFDLSGSILDSTNKFPQAVTGLKAFLKNSHPKNDYFLLSFAESQTLLVDVTENRKQIEESLNDLAVVKARGNTSLFDVLETAFEKASTLKHAKKAIIVVSDGQDTVSKKADFDDINQLAKRENVLLYLFNIQSRKDIATPPTPPSLEADQLFRTLMANSGGRGFYPKMPNETNQGFEMLADELRSLYIVEVRPNSPSDKPKWRKLRLKLSNQTEDRLGKVFLRVKKGFYF